ncbi:hypothetical protein D5086_000752 [Populus alba]|uniref:Uncharacterized protein n=1 Tax=Populus alba TaxID=43335 RepID=A0ACC4CXY8_POPAL
MCGGNLEEGCGTAVKGLRWNWRALDGLLMMRKPDNKYTRREREQSVAESSQITLVTAAIYSFVVDGNCPIHPAFLLATTSLHKPLLVIKCSSNSSEEIEPSNGNNLKDALSGMVDKQVEELLNRQENRVLLDGLEKASQRVEMARRELAEIERQELEAKQLRDYINQLESRASENYCLKFVAFVWCCCLILVEFKIAECQQEILEARAMVEEAERSLSLNNDGDALESKEISRDEERLESIKAVKKRLWTFSAEERGQAAAFGIVKVRWRTSHLELDPESFLSHVFNGAQYVSENLLIFAFAAVSLDFCFKTDGLLSPFPIEKGQLQGLI